MWSLLKLVFLFFAFHPESSSGAVVNTTLKIAESALDFVLLHNNDLHGRFDESSIVRTDCRPEEAQQNKCYGGFARIATLVKQYRESYQQQSGPPVLFMNAGDTFTGTAWFFLFKDKIAAEMMNALKPDVGSLGNHEFDYGVSGLVPYLEAIDFPIVAANLNITEGHPLWKIPSLRKSVVFNLKGFKVGVIGYVLPETKHKTNAGDVDFMPEIQTINTEAAELTKNGVNIIIALGHSGYPKDQEIARNCPLVDVVVGAHTHSFLYTGTPPVPEDVKGPYPTIVVQKSGKKVPVVQAYAYSKYLGKLELSFDKDGNLIRWSGLPILLDNQIPKDSGVQQLIEKYRPAVDYITKDIAGTTKVDLSDDCMHSECNLGNLITDSSVHTRAREYNGEGWTDAAVSIINGGGIRATIESGEVSRYLLSTALPFGNTLALIHVPGHVIKLALENSVALYSMTQEVKPFLQMSGLHVVYNLRNAVGDRVESVDVLCSNCRIPKYERLDMDKVYGVIIDSFLRSGGDGYKMFTPYAAQNFNLTSLQTTYDFIKNSEFIYTAVDGRIKFADQNAKSLATSTAPIPLLFALLASTLAACGTYM